MQLKSVIRKKIYELPSYNNTNIFKTEFIKIDGTVGYFKFFVAFIGSTC
jgi:hypothetical protein